MRNANKEKSDALSQDFLSRLRSQSVGQETISAILTSGDLFFNSGNTPTPFAQFPADPETNLPPRPIFFSNGSKEQCANVVTPKLVPPPPPVIIPATPLPIEPAPPVEEVTGTPGSEMGAEYAESPEALPEETPLDVAAPPMPANDIPEPEVESFPPKISNSNTPAKIPSTLAVTFKSLKGIVELPLSLPSADFCGSLHVPVENGHSVIMILLAKTITTGPDEVSVQMDGVQVVSKGAKIPTAWQEEVSSLSQTAATIQGDIGRYGPLAEEIITFLSGSGLKALAHRDKIEAVKGPSGEVIGYFQGDSLVQLVVTVAFVAEGPVSHYMGLPFPPLAGDGVDAYLLPASADFADFVQYLAAKNAVGWHDQKVRLTKDVLAEKRTRLAHALMWGGSAIIGYAAMAGMLGFFMPTLALLFAYLSFAVIVAVIAGTTLLWHRARRATKAQQLIFVNSTSWRLVNYARDQVDVAAAKLKGTYRQQFFGEMCPGEILEAYTSLKANPPVELKANEELNAQITATAMYVLDPRAGADDQKLRDVLAHAVSEAKHGRSRSAATIAIAAARARVQALLVRAERNSPSDMTSIVSLNNLFSATLARAKFSVSIAISVPLLALEQDLTANLPITQDNIVRGITAASRLIEQTCHLWPPKAPERVKEIPYPKTSKAMAPVMGSDLSAFDDDFG